MTKLEEVERVKLALLDAHFLIPQLQVRHPTLDLLTFASQDEVLKAVADLAIGNLKVVNQLIEDHYTGRLRVTGTVPDADSELYFAVRRDLPELSRLLRKGLDAMTDQEVSDIERRWLTVELTPGIAWDSAIRVGAFVLTVMLLLLAYLYLLRRANRRLRVARQIECDARQLAEDTTTSRGRFLGYLTHELRGTIGAIAAGAQMLKDDTAAERKSGLVDAINASANGFLALLEATLQYEQQLERSLTLNVEPADLRQLWPQMLAPLGLSAQAKQVTLSDARHIECDSARVLMILSACGRSSTTWSATPSSSPPRARCVSPAACRHKAVNGDGRFFELEVCDNGPGLTQDDVARLFQPYAQGVHGQRLRQGAGTAWPSRARSSMRWVGISALARPLAAARASRSRCTCGPA